MNAIISLVSYDIAADTISNLLHLFGLESQEVNNIWLDYNENYINNLLLNENCYINLMYDNKYYDLYSYLTAIRKVKFIGISMKFKTRKMLLENLVINDKKFIELYPNLT